MFTLNCPAHNFDCKERIVTMMRLRSETFVNGNNRSKLCQVDVKMTSRTVALLLTILTELILARDNDGFYSLNAEAVNFNKIPLSSFKGNVNDKL